MITDLEIAFADTCAADLRWAVDLDRQAWLDGLMLDDGRGARIEFGILGMSHQVVARVGDEEIIETVACGLGARAALPALHRGPSRVGAYEFTSQVHGVPLDEFDATVARLTNSLYGRTDAIVARFPRLPSAVTALAVDSVNRGVGWRTWHAYPQSGELVATRTQVRW